MKRLVVLDLNGTLLHRLTKTADIQAARSHPKYRPPDEKLSTTKQPVYMRPHLTSFLTALSSSDALEVAIWTSAMEPNAQAMLQSIKNINNDIEVEFKFVWGQGRCTTVAQANKHKPLFLKPILQIIQAYPELKKEDILIIDDSEEKFLEEDRPNHLRVPEFTVCKEEEDFTRDTVLSTLADWFAQMIRMIKPEETLVSYLKRTPPVFSNTLEGKDISEMMNNLKVVN